MIPYGNCQKMNQLSLVLSPAQVAINTTAEQTFSAPGVKLGDSVLTVNKPTAQAGLGIVGYRVSANDQIAITFSNVTGGAITPTASQTYLVVVARPDSTISVFS
jgi:hypothetical protein